MTLSLVIKKLLEPVYLGVSITIYQASLLISLDMEAIERYLSHPSKEPDYRQSRSHSQFLSSVNQLETDDGLEVFSSLDWLAYFNNSYSSCLEGRLQGELAPVDEKHTKHLFKRIDS